MDHLMVRPDDAFNAAHEVAIHAQELREELDRLSGDWGNLSGSWRGVVASAFSDAWDQWHDGASTLTDNLADAADRLGRAAVLYESQDAASAQAVYLTSPDVQT